MKAFTHSPDRDSQGTVGSEMSIRKGAPDLSATGSEEALNCSNDGRLGPGPDPAQKLAQDPAPAPPLPAAAPPREQDPAAHTPPLPQPAATGRSPCKPAIADEILSTASDLAAETHQRQQQQREQRQARRSSRQSAGSSTRRCRSRGHHHTTVTQQAPPPAPYVPYGYQDYRASSSRAYDDYDDEYDDGRGPPPCSRRWRRIKRALTLLSMVWAGVVLALACLFAAQGGMADSVGVWSIPIAIAALVWNSAELLVYAARARGVAPSGPTGRGPAHAAVAGRPGVRRGIHPGAHVGLHLCLWLACALAIYLTMMVYQDVQNTMADCAAAAAAAATAPGAGGPDDHCQAAYHYTSNLHLFRQGFYSPGLRALLAMFGLATATHFALFVRACVEVDRRNRARFAAADEEGYAASIAAATTTTATAADDARPAVPVYGMAETGGPWTWVQPPDYYRTSGGRHPPAPDSHIVTTYDESGGPPLPDGTPGAGGATKERV